MSPFRPGTKEDANKAHITERTKISSESLGVEKLIGTNENEYQMDYVSFKIVTVSYDMLMCMKK